MCSLKKEKGRSFHSQLKLIIQGKLKLTKLLTTIPGFLKLSNNKKNI